MRSLRWGWAVAVLSIVVLAVSWVYMVLSSVTVRMDIREVPGPTSTVFVPLERVVPGPTVTVTATAKPRPAPTVTVTREASVGRSRPSGQNLAVDAFLRCVIVHESGGDPRAENPYSSASGLFQFIDSSWRAYSRSAGVTGYSRASQAPASVQWEVARHVVTEYGKYPWKGTNCGGGT